VKEILLLLIAVVLLYLLLPIVFVFMLLKYLIGGNTRLLKVWAWKVSRGIDVFANVHGSDLFNIVFIKTGGYQFGNRQETISSVIGKNQRNKTLAIAGKVLRWMLDRIAQDHCLNSIREELTNTTK